MGDMQQDTGRERAAGGVELPALIVPDIHNRVDDAEALIAKHGGDCRSIVFLGDYFDSYDGGPMEAHVTGRWLKRSLATPGRFHLLGNHDASYFFNGHPQTVCAGWSEENQKVIQEVWRDCLPSSSFHLALEVGPWLVSHAGFSGRDYRHAPKAALLAWAKGAKRALIEGKEHPLLVAGLVRGGREKRGGVLWCDFDSEFAALPGVHQLVGHTRSARAVRCRQLLDAGTIGYGQITDSMAWGRLPDWAREPWRSVNWCLDVELRACATVTDHDLVLHLPERSFSAMPAPQASPSEDPWPLLRAADLPVCWTDAPPCFVPWDALRAGLAEPLFSRLVHDAEHRDASGGADPAEVERVLRASARQ